jgi:glutaryl-CoA dehydrogenase
MAHDPLDIAGIEDELQDEERLVRDSVARFVDDEVLPIIGRCFAEHSFPRELIAPMARLGLLGSSLEGYGCAGLNAVSYGLICRELERGDSALRSFVSVQSSLCMFPIYTYGSPEQRERWLPGMARGEIIGCFGLTEAHGGSDPLNMNTTAKRQGGDWVLNGSKMWITNAPLADVAIVWALTDEGVRGFLDLAWRLGLLLGQLEDGPPRSCSIASASWVLEIAMSSIASGLRPAISADLAMRARMSCS